MSQPKCTQNVTQFSSFKQSSTTSGKLNSFKIREAILCLYQQESIPVAEKRNRDNPLITDKYSDKIRSILSHELGTVSEQNEYRITGHQTAILNSLEGLPASGEVSDRKLKALFDYHKAQNACVSSKITNAQGASLGLQNRCEPSTFQAYQRAQANLEKEFPAATGNTRQARPEPRLADLQTQIACEKVRSVEANRNAIECNARAYCAVWTSNNQPVLGQTRISSAAAEADHSRLRIRELSGCENANFIPLCKSNFYRHESSTRNRPKFVLGNKPANLLEKIPNFFTQTSCPHDRGDFMIPRISNEYGDGSVFYSQASNSNLSDPNYCRFQWDLYLDSYKNSLIAEFKLDTSYLDCEGVPSPRGSSTPNSPSTRARGIR